MMEDMTICYSIFVLAIRKHFCIINKITLLLLCNGQNEYAVVGYVFLFLQPYVRGENNVARLQQEFAKNYIKIILLNMDDTFVNGKAAMDARQWEEAMSLFNEVISKDSTNAKALYYRAGIFKKNHELQRAKDDYEAMTKLNIRDEDRWLALAFLHELNESVSNQKGMTQSVGYATKEFQQAVFYYSKIIEVSPKDEEARVDRSIIYCKLGQYAEAIEDATVVIATNTDKRALSRSYASRAMAYLLLGNLAKADSDTQKSLSFSSQQPRANYLLGCIHEQKQQFDEA
jgi:tetratricopeptide (TPR) repeat protein